MFRVGRCLRPRSQKRARRSPRRSRPLRFTSLLLAALLPAACSAPPKTVKLAPARVPSPQIRLLEADAAKARPWKLIAARDVAGVLLEEYRLGENGPKLAVSIDPAARALTLQAHVLSMSKARVEAETVALEKSAASIGGLASGGAAADRGYVAVTFLPAIEPAALEAASRAIVRPTAAYSAAGAVDRVLLLNALKEALASPELTDSAASVPADPVARPEGTLRLAWSVESATPAESVALEAAARVLADGPESRLGRTLPARSIVATAGSRTFELAIALEPGRTSTAATALVDREIKALSRGETTGLEVENARARVRAKLLFELSSLESRARMCGAALLQPGGVATLYTRFESIEKLDEKTMRAAVAKHLKPSLVSTR